jgi:V/A-type H+-transporting ATPase subunit B
VEFERRFIAQGEQENRDIQNNLDLGWRLLGMLPKAELKRVRDEFIQKYGSKVEAIAVEA